jgi:putative chitinase
MLTSRDNYKEAAAALGLPLLDDPDLISRDSATAVVVAAWWWWTRGCNALADALDFKALTRRINGGLNGHEDRVSRWNAVRAAWGMK